MKTVPLSEAKDKLSALVDEADTTHEIVQITKLAPLERLGETADIAGVVAFLLSAEGGWINSQVLRVNGGFA